MSEMGDMKFTTAGDMVSNPVSWDSYCEVKQQLEYANERIYTLEMALEKILEKTQDCSPMSYLSEYFRIAKTALNHK